MEVGFSIYEMLCAYFNNAKWFYAVVLAFLFCIIMGEKTVKKRWITTIVFSILLVFNDLSKAIFEKIFPTEATYYRFLWMVPMTIVMSYAVVLFIDKCKPTAVKIAVCVGLICAIAFFGLSWVDDWGFLKLQNPYLLSNETMEISELIHEDTDDEKISVVLPMPMELEMRIYDPSIVTAIKRSAYIQYYRTGLNDKQKTQNCLIEFVNSYNASDEVLIRKSLWSRKAKYLLIQKEKFSKEFMEGIGCEYMDTVNSFELYRVNRKKLRRLVRRDRKSEA